MSKNTLTRRSLTQHFMPAPGFVGEFGWICGYSADAKFIDMAAERFTGQVAARRARTGCIRLALLLDPGNPQLTIAEAPGVLHCPVQSQALPFRLLHAKVAILGFRSLDDIGRFQLRLLVSTGNWTRATLEDNLDLAWRIDIDSDDLASANVELRRRCADIDAAWDLVTWLRGYFDSSLLGAVPAHLSDTETLLAQRELEKWLLAARKRAAGVARFFDNRGQSLLASLRRKLGAEGILTARNYLAMGSGFYEGGTSGALPSVPQAIVAGLRDNGLLTQTAGIDLYANPTACQAVAEGIKSIKNEGWTVRAPAGLGYGNRFMHAKFLFSARYKDTSNRCSSAWSYLGSGNLTGPGFLQRASAGRGNLEAGVVQSHEDLYWEQADGLDPSQVISNLLPLQWDEELGPASSLAHGEEMAWREPQFVAPPLSFLLWQPARADGGWLCCVAPESLPFEVLAGDGTPCPREADGRIRWDGLRPLQVSIAWEADGRACRALVPVMDEHGRVAAAPMSGLGVEEAGWELEGFPATIGEEDGDDEEEGDDVDVGSGGSGEGDTPASRHGTKQYPIRQMMALIEQIAEKQCSIAQIDWPAWCHRLEQVLARVGGSDSLAAFLELELNPLSALYMPAFRPAYAESAASDDGRRYEEALARIGRAWDVGGLAPMGEHV